VQGVGFKVLPRGELSIFMPTLFNLVRDQGCQGPKV
jgi:hypothetical protein